MFLNTKNCNLLDEPFHLQIYSNTIDKVKGVYKFSRENSKWYSQSLSAYNSDSDFLNVWKLAPELTKLILREKGEELLTHEVDNSTLEFITTGSTGIPTKTFWESTEYNRCTLEVWNARRKLGAKLNENVVYFNGLPKGGSCINEERIDKTSDTTFELIRVFTEKATKVYSDFINTLDGVVLYGSPSTIYNFSNSLRTFGIAPPKVSCIELNGEMCEEYEADVIKHTFKSPVLNNYGAREMWPIALSCKHGTMHICNNLVYVESNAQNEILITSLIKKMQPLIKYNLGDLGSVTWAECECGKTSQVLTSLIGRKNDYIYRSPGLKEHWALLSKAISNFICENSPSILEYSVHQKIDYSITISIVPGEKYDAFAKNALLKVVESIYPDICFEINNVTEISQNYRGKKVYLTCDVKEVLK